MKGLNPIGKKTPVSVDKAWRQTHERVFQQWFTVDYPVIAPLAGCSLLFAKVAIISEVCHVFNNNLSFYRYLYPLSFDVFRRWKTVVACYIQEFWRLRTKFSEALHQGIISILFLSKCHCHSLVLQLAAHDGCVMTLKNVKPAAFVCVIWESYWYFSYFCDMNPLHRKQCFRVGLRLYS